MNAHCGEIMNILVIDDNKDITDVISILAESQGHSCIVSNNGKEGCNLIKKENFDLILLDIAMPKFSGYDVLNTLKKDSNFNMKKIIIITASDLYNLTDEKIKSLGVFKLLSKPFSSDSLKDIFSEFA